MEYNFNDLYDAIEIGDLKEAREILSKKPFLIHEKDEYGFTAVHAIGSMENKRLARFILEKEIDVNVKNEDGITALHIVMYPKTAQLLIDYGADVNCIDNEGNTPLHEQASNGEERRHVIKVLLKNGADKSIKNKDGETAYDIAKVRGEKVNMRILE